MDNSIGLVIFDCDGVLIDSEIISARLLQAEMQKLGAKIDMQHILAHYVGRSYPTVLADIQSRFSIQLTDDFEHARQQRLFAVFETELQPIPAVKNIITRLNTPYCVATSSSQKRVNRSLELTHLNMHFSDNVFTASEVKHGKPEPDLFLYAAAKMQVHPKNCLVIEDSVFGVQAGIAAGMMTARFTGGSHLLGTDDKAGADMQFNDFEDFFDFFPNLEK